MRTHTWIILVVSAGIALALAAAPNDVQENPGAEAQLQAAINKETVEGDLKGAIELYRKLADSDDHAVAAKALVRMGQCHEKLGNAEARRAYERVVRDFSDQKEMVATAQARLAALAAAGGTAGSPTLTVRRVLEGPFLGKVSADGRFLSFTDDNGNVAVRDLATGRRRVLTDNAGYAEPSILSPDGRSVAYTSGGLWVVGTDGSKPKVLRARGNGVHHAWPVSWSPDSRHLLAEFVKTDGTFDMMLVSVEDGSAKLLKAMGRDQSPGGEFSPDGRYIAWATGDGLSLFDLQTGTESPLIPDRSNPSVLGWAPDGRHILFSSESLGSPDAWLIAMADGKARGEPVLVRKNWGNLPMGITRSGAFYYGVINNIWEVQIADLDPAGGNEVSPSQPAFKRGNTRAGAWSPDGCLLAAIDAREPRRAVIIRSMDTGEERELQIGGREIMNGSLRWTPDGKAVVVPASEPGKGEGLIRIDVQTGQVTTLMPLPALGGWPRFELSRDGNTVFYVRPADPPAAGAALVSFDLRSGQETEIVKKSGLLWGAKSPDGQRVVVMTISNNVWSLLVRPASGGEFRELARVDRDRDYASGASPWWSPDGRHIVFLIFPKGAKRDYPRQWQVWRVSVEGGEPQRIGQIAARQLVGFQLHPDGRRVAISNINVDLEVWVMENFLPSAKSAK